MGTEELVIRFIIVEYVRNLSYTQNHLHLLPLLHRRLL